MLSFIRGDSILVIQSHSQNNDSETTGFIPYREGKTVWANHFKFKTSKTFQLSSWRRHPLTKYLMTCLLFCWVKNVCTTTIILLFSIAEAVAGGEIALFFPCAERSSCGHFWRESLSDFPKKNMQSNIAKWRDCPLWHNYRLTYSQVGEGVDLKENRVHLLPYSGNLFIYLSNLAHLTLITLNFKLTNCQRIYLDFVKHEPLK